MHWMLMPLRRYADFSGRSRRKEYWMFVLLQLLVGAAVGLLALLLGNTTTTRDQMTMVLNPVLVLAGLFSLFCLIPGLAVTIRRLHDTDRSAWNLLWALVPVGAFVLLYFYIDEGDPGPNRFGEDPKGEDMESGVFA
ncbi:MAG TPA: DUF805 domain-containing protein [Allosphingosinicella sp.]|nr:DUF805 domain-containing protein [Allosphingosinicella sp.]